MAVMHLHLGAHRTGTSSLQMCLHDNRAALAAAGWALAYPGRDGIPSGELALRLPRPRDKDAGPFVAKVAATLTDRAGDRDLVLSEENVPGRMFHFLQGRFYPAAEARLRVLRAGWPGTVGRALLVVRRYDELFLSGYRKRAEENPVPDFADLRDNYMAMDRGWPDLADLVREILAPETLTVVEYTVRGESRDLLARLVPGTKAEDLAEPDHRVNLSASDAALSALQRRFRAGKTPGPKRRADIIARHADNRERGSFAAFEPEQVKTLRDRYAADLDAIAKMPGMTLIR